MDHFRIEDDMTAEWALSQIRAAKEEKEKWEAFYKERLRIIHEKCDETIANMESMLQTYFEAVPTRSQRRRKTTRSLPGNWFSSGRPPSSSGMTRKSWTTSRRPG